MHPETPAEGVAIKDALPDVNMERMISNLNNAGAPYNIMFNKIDTMCNTRLALEASEFAKDQGKFEQLHNNIFKAYFTENKNIGKLEVILDIAETAGLDKNELRKALKEKEYSPRLTEAITYGKQFQVAGLPTFIINGNKKLVGAQPYQKFVEAIESSIN